MNTKQPKWSSDDLFVALGERAREKDIAVNGPNPPLSTRSLHAVTLTMAEILEVYRHMENEH